MRIKSSPLSSSRPIVNVRYGYQWDLGKPSEPLPPSVISAISARLNDCLSSDLNALLAAYGPTKSTPGLTYGDLKYLALSEVRKNASTHFAFAPIYIRLAGREYRG